MMKKTLATLSIAALVAGFGLVLQAGEMEPPGPPGPTMKPLNELEPRIPIHAAQLPLTISESGSYYLAENVSTSGAGITVDADNVTIDLMGFTLEGGTGNGITVLSGRLRTTVRNGRVKGWAQHGLALQDRAHVVGVLAEDNSGNGIQTGAYSAVIDSVADFNFGHGIVVDFESTVRGCRATTNSENGIWAGTSSHVSDSYAHVNDRNGFRIESDSYVVGCSAQFNDQNQFVDGAGIWVRGDNNRIDGNHLVWNNVGMNIDGNDNIIVRNTIWKAQGGPPYYDLDPGATGNLLEIATSISTAGPWSNFTP